jgi:thioredoxin
MKKIILALTAIVSLFGNACYNQAAPPEAFIKTIDATEFKRLADAGNGIILDVRAPEEVASGYIANASTINFYDEDFVGKINLIPKDKEIYVYCKVGSRSAQAAEILRQNGFNMVFHLGKGLVEWEEKGYPLIKTQIGKDEKIQEISLEDFKALLKTDKPVLIDFHTVWCAPCRKMAPIVDKIEEDFKGKAVVMRIDVDKSSDVGKAYNIKGVPVFILFKDGSEIWKHNGALSEEELIRQIDIRL